MAQHGVSVEKKKKNWRQIIVKEKNKTPSENEKEIRRMCK